MYLGIIGPSAAGISIGISLSDPPRSSAVPLLRVPPPPRKIPSNASKRHLRHLKRRRFCVLVHVFAKGSMPVRKRTHVTVLTQYLRDDRATR